MNAEEEVESAPPGGADKAKKRKKRPDHVHVGPYARAYRAGLAFCPVCDDSGASRMVDEDRILEKRSKSYERTKRNGPVKKS